MSFAVSHAPHQCLGPQQYCIVAFVSNQINMVHVMFVTNCANIQHKAYFFCIYALGEKEKVIQCYINFMKTEIFIITMNCVNVL